jgi:hypothetical protein
MQAAQRSPLNNRQEELFELEPTTVQQSAVSRFWFGTPRAGVTATIRREIFREGNSKTPLLGRGLAFRMAWQEALASLNRQTRLF